MMKRVFDSIAHLGREWKKEVSLALGMFDGVHRGHQVVLDSAATDAAKFCGTSVALTFPKHPASFLRPGKEPALIMNPTEKSKKLLSSGMGAVIMHPFDQELSEVPAVEFVHFLKERIPNIRSICVGQNFRFGQNRTGDSVNLIAYGSKEEIDVKVAESLILNDFPISSSRIREALSVGDMDQVNDMLGRKYLVSGEVVAGKSLGRTMGFPTLNLAWSPEAKPAYGVYAGWVEEAKSGQKMPAVANYGLRPTVSLGADLPLLEIHCLEQPDLSFWNEGAELSMELSTMIRTEKKFAGVADLKLQIEQDCEIARKLFSEGL